MSTISDFRKAFEAGDHAGVVATLAEDVVLHSPAVIETHYPGRAVVARILGFALQTTEDRVVTDELHGDGGRTHALLLEGRVGPERLQGCLYLRTDGDGLIDEVTFMLRPLRAVSAFVSAMGALGAQPALDLEAGGR